MTLVPGTKLGPYEIVAPLGAGGMGEVYRARDTRLQRDVALKVLPPDAADDEDAGRRFRAEAVLLSQLNHPHVATVYDFDRAGGRAYLAMELVAGDTLEDRLRAGPMPEDAALAAGVEMADALTAAHAMGVIHRDLKPSNLRFAADGRLKVLDFGLARLLPRTALAQPALTLTMAHATAGTLGYLAPEVLAGRTPDESGDVYAMGVVLYEMLSGRRPYEADGPLALMYAVLNHEPVPLTTLRPGLSREIESVVERAMAHDPALRCPSAAALLADLRRLREQAAAVAEEGGPAVIRSLAVLPLENLSGDPGQEFFSDGMTEALIGDLARLPGLRVISRTSVMRFKGVRKPLPEIGAELRVDAVVEGAVLRSGDRVRVSSRLLRAATEEQVWGGMFERDLKDIFALQSDLAAALGAPIRQALEPGSPGPPTPKPPSRAPVDASVYDRVLRARQLIHRRSEEGLLRAVEVLGEALMAAPDFAEASVVLAQAHALLGFTYSRDPREAFPAAYQAAMRAVELDPNSGEAHAAVAYVHLFHRWDLATADTIFERAIALAPHQPTVVLWQTNLFSVRGEVERARVAARHLVEVDPLSPMANMLPAYISHSNREFDRGVDEARRVIDMDPNFPIAHLWQGTHLFGAGRPGEAVAALENAIRIRPQYAEALAALAQASAALGDGTRARGMLSDLRRLGEHHFLPAHLVAWVHGALGELDAGFAELERALEQRVNWLVFIDRDFRFDPFRSDPRFAPIRERVLGRV